jgi:hypothetical protein
MGVWRLGIQYNTAFFLKTPYKATPPLYYVCRKRHQAYRFIGVPKNLDQLADMLGLPVIHQERPPARKKPSQRQLKPYRPETK